MARRRHSGPSPRANGPSSRSADSGVHNFCGDVRFAGSGEPEQVTLCMPVLGQGMNALQAIGGEVHRMAPIEDRLDDVGSEEGQGEDPGQGGSEGV